MSVRFPSRWLTVVISDTSRFVHLQEPVTHRTVRVELTDQQMQKLQLRCTGSLGRTDIFEEVSQVFFDEPDDQKDQA